MGKRSDFLQERMKYVYATGTKEQVQVVIALALIELVEMMEKKEGDDADNS